MAEAIILVGLQGAGKTSYFEKNLAGTHVHISRDVQKTGERELALFRECLSAGRSLVVDDTNTTRAVRAPFVAAAKAARFTVKAVFFDTPTRTAIGRNNYRKDKNPIPVPAILRTAKVLQPPSLDEGFELIKVIEPEADESKKARR
jgi:predicted kinase